MPINITESDIKYLKKLKHLYIEERLNNEEELKKYIKFLLNSLNNIFEFEEIKDKNNN